MRQGLTGSWETSDAVRIFNFQTNRFQMHTCCFCSTDQTENVRHSGNIISIIVVLTHVLLYNGTGNSEGNPAFFFREDGGCTSFEKVGKLLL